MRGLLGFLVAWFVASGLLACGEADEHRASASRTSSDTTQSRQRFKGDEDDDETRENDNPRNKADGDADKDNDYNENVLNGYRDSDDTLISDYGHAPSATEAQSLIVFVKRYFVAAQAEDGATVCPMIQSAFAKAIPESYGVGGPAYLRGASTCRTVMTRLFKHLHAELNPPPQVTNVRVKGKQAYVILGSARISASYVTLEREGGGWRLLGLIGVPLP